MKGKTSFVRERIVSGARKAVGRVGGEKTRDSERWQKLEEAMVEGGFPEGGAGTVLTSLNPTAVIPPEKPHFLSLFLDECPS
jgi:hypothetical protein